MNKQKTKKILAIVLSATLVLGVCAFASEGTADDPLISLSYVEEVLKPYIDSAVEGAAPASATYEVVTLSKGQTLTAGAGTELILRSGSAKAQIDADASGGFTDVTGAVDVSDNMPLSANHLLICPRGDGRAVSALSNEVYLMVKGAYTIE